jgi:hypothetical protein
MPDVAASQANREFKAAARDRSHSANAVIQQF